MGKAVADRFLSGVRRGAARMEMIVPGDFDVASGIAGQFPDLDFSIVDRTSFAVMQRLGILRAASFDDDFAIFRFGPRRGGGARFSRGCARGEPMVLIHGWMWAGMKASSCRMRVTEG